MNRRDALRTAAWTAAATFVPRLAAADAKPKRIASVNSVYHKLSHAYHIAGRFLSGYTLKGQHHQPPFQLVRMFNDQYHADGARKDLSRDLAKKKNFEIADTITAALGGKGKLDVEGVMLICEHGDYPRNKLGQILYPRYEFFEQIVEVFKTSGRSVPVFVDKHLSYDHVKARKMYDTAKAMGFGLMAGSSLPVTWRQPEWEPPFGAKVQEAVVCFASDLEVYGFHALEVLQNVLERRAGGETGVKSIATIQGDAVWKAWDRGDWDKDVAEAALRRSGSRDYGSPRDHVEKPSAFRVEYIDGTRATLLHLPGYVADFTIGVKFAGDPKPQATGFYLPLPPGARFFDPLTYYIEQFFTTGKSPYPVERTLLTSTMLDFAHRSLADGSKPMTGEALKIVYQPANESYFFRGPFSDD
ncbi:hypothetical protein [Limnoglobus roseus]|uniref:Uncharacterized protein n=1 Tax=Limnoglobus roseus TaxID=2598579 RepID=A0A5C1AMI9_9BACT|nr:hypothetical protein [Limnoglobus roseus]QEL18118.1 hypothetical protein PX52LOC_05132 [Limnoglobus roseus]